MQEQEQVGRARIIGYAIGIAAFLVVAAGKHLIR